MFGNRRLPKVWRVTATVAVLVALVVVSSPAGAATPGTEVPLFEELVFDPVEARVTVRAPSAADGTAADGATICSEVHAWVTARTPWPLHNIVYRYNHVVGWCWDGETVTDIEEDRDWLSHVDSTYRWEGTEEEAKRYYRWGGVSRGRYRSYMQGLVQQCIHSDWACLNFYPWITINVYADGDSDYDGDAG